MGKELSQLETDIYMDLVWKKILRNVIKNLQRAAEHETDIKCYTTTITMEKDHKETLENKERKYNHKNYWCTAELWCDPTETHKGEQKKTKIQTQLQKQLQKMKGHKKLQTEKKTATEEQEKTTKYKNKHDNHIYTKTVKKKTTKPEVEMRLF